MLSYCTSVMDSHISMLENSFNVLSAQDGLVDSVDVEICVKTTHVIDHANLEKAVLNMMGRTSQVNKTRPKKDSNGGSSLPDITPNDIVAIRASLEEDVDTLEALLAIPKSIKLSLHVYQLYSNGPSVEEITHEDEQISAATHWMLPSAEFEGLWESLFYDSNVKEKLVNYAKTTLLFADANVDCNIISWNRVILLHGPPGTGKTSLCKALAQKICVRLSHRYAYGQLVEINSHSLFSKWFSESGKLVLKMFDKINEFIADQSSLVVVLIDEVESLSASRSRSPNEPSDAIRVVNALLTQIDHLKRHPNVLIMTTSNITGAIDLAFVDRADIKQYIGPPTQLAIYTMLRTCVLELMRTGIIQPEEQLVTYKNLELVQFENNGATKFSIQLYDLSKQCEGMSGRSIRKLPFLAYATYMMNKQVSLGQFLGALSKAVNDQISDNDLMNKK